MFTTIYVYIYIYIILIQWGLSLSNMIILTVKQITRILTDPKEFLQREEREKKELEAAENAEKEAIEKEANRVRLKKEARLRQRIEAHAKKMSSEKSRIADEILKSENVMVPLELADKLKQPKRLPN
jgi:hypothetical protein